MNDFALSSEYFGSAVTLAAYALALACAKRFGHNAGNPLIISSGAVIIFLLSTGVEYDSYIRSAKYIGNMLTPATICFAVPLYKKLPLLKKHAAAIMAGIASGVAVSMTIITAASAIASLGRAEFLSFLPTSVTTAVAMALAEEYGGIPALSAVIVMITGLFGAAICQPVCAAVGIKNPVAMGLAIGCSCHAAGTSRAIEIGETEGAFSSLATAVSPLICVTLAPLFAGLYG